MEQVSTGRQMKVMLILVSSARPPIERLPAYEVLLMIVVTDNCFVLLHERISRAGATAVAVTLLILVLGQSGYAAYDVGTHTTSSRSRWMRSSNSDRVSELKGNGKATDV
jgi:hypothetical protein